MPLVLKPDFAYAYYLRGFAYGDLKEYNKATNDWERSFKFKPTYYMDIHPGLIKESKEKLNKYNVL